MTTKYGGPGRDDLAGRDQADEQPATAGKEFLGDQHFERRAHRATNDANRLSAENEIV